jgi:hypothetical protein
VPASTALQNGMMQLLPGGPHQYVGAAAVHAAQQAAFRGSWEQQVEEQIIEAEKFVYALFCSLQSSFQGVPAEQQPSLSAPALQAAAVHLMLELQLVAASLLQLRWQQGQKAASKSFLLVGLCCRMLDSQIRAVLQASGSNSLPPVLLQQTGLQLLRALAAPVQQLQLLLAHQQQKDSISGASYQPGRALCSFAVAVRRRQPHWPCAVHAWCCSIWTGDVRRPEG